MRRLVILLLTTMTITLHSNGQELIPNGGFEEYYHCPTGLDQIDSTKFWKRANEATTDFLHTCGTNSANLPDSWLGYQYPRTGNGCAGIVQFCYGGLPSGSFPEYLEVLLNSPLIPDNYYWFEMYINACNKSSLIASNVGVYFSDTFLHKAGNFYVPAVAQIKNGRGAFPDTLNWRRVSGTYKARGGERYLTIGNFEHPALIDTITVGSIGPSGPSNWSYIYVDDVSLKHCTPGTAHSPCNPEFVHATTQQRRFSIQPNPFSDIMQVIADDEGNATIIFYDIALRTVLEQSFRKVAAINTTRLSAGAYYYEIKQSDVTVQRGKLIKQ